ncbi:LysE family translocator [Galactobacter valiniphilus]|uniref:LysE family translocator n=1 Tax=Galactobacter valiniphilus TaxID=2676122 RepID=A0A399JGP0_9MICC|nr:LysE family translocator [Galactobacter valiniphilus]RII41646.1 LysE family translocator [Galactobacter valiniphilus]
MDATMIWAFWGVSILFILTPGADWAYAISGGLRQRVLPSVSGLWMGHVVAIAVVVAGVGALLERFPSITLALTLLGAAYLVWLGLGVLRSSGTVGEATDVPVGSSGRWFAKGIGVASLNPKLVLLLTAVLPQFTRHDAAWPVQGQIAVLGGFHLLGCAVVYLAVGAGSRRVLGARPGAARVVTRISGVAMIGIGLVLLAERVAELIH